MTFLALDVGGTKTAAGVVTAAGEVLSRVRLTTAELRDGGDPLAALIRLGREALKEAGTRLPDGVGLALPGPVDHLACRMLTAPTLPEFAGVPLAEPLRRAFGAGVHGDNDANACALGEAMFGAGRGHRHVVYVTISTGIGGGVVLDGRIYRGARGTSAEFGHQEIVPQGGPSCDCGGTGCLEALASGRGITRLGYKWYGEHLSPEVLADLARAGDYIVPQAWEEAALYLGLGLSNIINLFDPDVMVLGGGVGVGAADLLLEPIRAVVEERSMPRLRRRTPIVVAELGTDVGLVGAASLCLER